MNKRLILASAIVCALMAGCSTTSPGMNGSDPVARRTSIDANVDAALTKLTTQNPSSAAMLQRARGVLVFPNVVSAGLVVGGSYGTGELRVGGRPEAYYSTTAVSVGLLAGADSKAVYILFMTDESLQKFRSSRGWTAGVDASVSVLNAGADIGLDTQTAQRPIVGYVLTNAGLMANVAIDGTKITKLDL